MSFRYHSEMQPIPGFPGYSLSEDGRIFSSLRGGLKERKRPVAGNGYVVLRLRAENGQYVSRTLHRLMLETFVGKDARLTRHLDGDKTNNALGNLKYGTPVENAQDYVQHGHHYSKRKSCKWGHEYNEKNTRERTNKKGSTFRECVPCTLRRADESRARRRGSAAPVRQ